MGETVLTHAILLDVSLAFRVRALLGVLLYELDRCFLLAWLVRDTRLVHFAGLFGVPRYTALDALLQLASSAREDVALITDLAGFTSGRDTPVEVRQSRESQGSLGLEISITQFRVSSGTPDFSPSFSGGLTYFANVSSPPSTRTSCCEREDPHCAQEILSIDVLST